jgi:hypothetical protein
MSPGSAVRYGAILKAPVIELPPQGVETTTGGEVWVTDGTAQIDSDEGYPWQLQPSSLRARASR